MGRRQEGRMTFTLFLLGCLVVSRGFVWGLPSAAVEVVVSGDFMQSGLQGDHCDLPDVINVTITSNDVIISLAVSKSSRVTQDAPVYVIGDDGQVRHVTTREKDAYALYQHLNTGAALIITCHLGQEKPSVEGTVTYQGRQFHLRHSSRRRRDVSSVTSESDEYQLTEVPEDPVKDQTIDYLLPPEFHRLHNSSSTLSPRQETAKRMQNDIIWNNTVEGQAQQRGRRQAETVPNIYIDVTVVVAFDLYEQFYNDSDATEAEDKMADAMGEIKKHYALLMSEVDLHYQMIGSRLPYNISIGLASFVVAQSMASSRWTEEHKQIRNESDRYVVDASEVLRELAVWVASSASLPPMDYYVLFTGYDLFYKNGSGLNLGLAYRGGVCASTEWNTLSPGRNSAVVEDNIAFFSRTVIVTVHELGHGLGAPHDGDANECAAADNFVMTSRLARNNETNYGVFSECSLSSFDVTFTRLSLSLQSESCLHEIISPAGVPNVTGLVPGQVYDVQTQCKRAFGDESSVCPSLTSLGDAMCTKTYCRNPLYPGKCSSIQLLRGTTCGDKMWCVNAFCVPSPDAGQMDESCPFGDRVSMLPNINMTCAEYVGQFKGHCYRTTIADNCCASCAEVQTASESCPFGDKVSTLPLYNMTCAEHVGGFHGHCYWDYVADSCCGTCDAVNMSSETCPFGDRFEKPYSDSNRTCSQYVQEASRRCYDSYFQTQCCHTCEDVKQNGSESCAYGDRRRLPYRARSETCIEIAATEPWRCYDTYFHHTCCQACQDIDKGLSGCEFGDRVPDCSLSSCPNQSLWLNCCGTCSSFLPASSTVSSTASTSTNASITSVPTNIPTTNATGNPTSTTTSPISFTHETANTTSSSSTAVSTTSTTSSASNTASSTHITDVFTSISSAAPTSTISASTTTKPTTVAAPPTTTISIPTTTTFATSTTTLTATTTSCTTDITTPTATASTPVKTTMTAPTTATTTPTTTTGTTTTTNTATTTTPITTTFSPTTTTTTATTPITTNITPTATITTTSTSPFTTTTLPITTTITPTTQTNTPTATTQTKTTITPIATTATTTTAVSSTTSTLSTTTTTTPAIHTNTLSTTAHNTTTTTPSTASTMISRTTAPTTTSTTAITGLLTSTTTAITTTTSTTTVSTTKSSATALFTSTTTSSDTTSIATDTPLTSSTAAAAANAVAMHASVSHTNSAVGSGGRLSPRGEAASHLVSFCIASGLALLLTHS